MARARLLKNAFLLVVFVGVLHFVAIKLSLYWTLHYFDSVVHFFAGVSVGFASLWLCTKDDMPIPISSKKIFLTSFLGALGVGLVWEVFELLSGITTLSDGIHYVTDTGSDLFMDIFGGVVAGWYFYKTRE